MRTFDPFDLEKPILRLGAGNEFTLADITDSRGKKLGAIGERINAIDMDADGADREFLESVCDLVEAACEKPGAGVIIRELWDSEQIGARALQGCIEFVMEWLSAGEA